MKHRAGLGILSRTQCKVSAFHCFPAGANVCPTSWDSLRLASPLLHSFLPSPFSTYKGERRRKGVKQVESCGWKGRWKGWIWLERLGEDDARVMRGWSEVGAMVE